MNNAIPVQEGLLFADRYTLVRPLGEGGFSVVWLATDSITQLDVVIKIWAPGQGMDQNGLNDFCNELAIVHNLNHTNLLKPQHVDSWHSMPYLTMMYCSNGSCVNRIGKMTDDELLHFLRDVSAGLAYLHRHGIIHQDIKPDNILIDDNGQYLITDFGISSRARNTLRKSMVVQDEHLKSTGTIDYMGPERFSEQPEPVMASDIWALGATVFELIEGILPYPPRLGGMMQKNGAEIPKINQPVSSDIKKLVHDMLHANPDKRPTAEEIYQRVSNPSANPNPSKKKWYIAAAAALAIGLTVIGVHYINLPSPYNEETLNRNFERHLAAADIDHINRLQDAYTSYSELVKQNGKENVYMQRREIIVKSNELYAAAQERYYKAPQSSPEEKVYQLKMDSIEHILNSLKTPK